MGNDWYVDPTAAGNNDGGGDGAAHTPTDADNWTDAWVSLQSAADGIAAGDVVYCRGTQTIAAAIDFDTAAATGSATAGYVKFIGCNATTGAIDGSRFKLDAGTADIHCISANGAMDYVWLENIECDGYSSATNKDCIYIGTATTIGWVIVNCSLHGASRGGIYDDGSRMTSCTVYRCCIYSNGAGGVYGVGSTNRFLFSSVYDNTGDGFSSSNPFILGCIIYDNGDDGVDTASGTLISSVIDSNPDDGINVNTSGTAPVVIGCRITNHSGAGHVGLNPNSRVLVAAYNYLDNNDDHKDNDTYLMLISLAGGTTDSNEYGFEVGGGTPEAEGTLQGYTSDSDYNLTSTADLRRDAITIPLT